MKSLFKIFLLAAAAILVCSQAVWAADAFPCDWTGFYLGAHLGGGFSSTHMYLYDPLRDTSILHPDPGGVIGGGQIGYNLQRGPFVLGLEADLSGSGMRGSDNSFPPPGIVGGTTVRSQENVNWFGTVRPRLGYTPIPRLLLYATGGLAYGNVSYSVGRFTGSYPVTAYASSSGTNVGWTVGGGVEYRVSKKLSVRVQYLFYNLGDKSLTATSTYVGPGPIPWIAARATSDFSAGFSVFDVGLNYRFD